MSESFFNKPKAVQEAVVMGDKRHLKSAGHKGGIATAKMRELAKVLKEEATAKELADAIAHEEELLSGDDMEEDRKMLHG